jgi:hypothetical protein
MTFSQMPTYLLIVIITYTRNPPLILGILNFERLSLIKETCTEFMEALGLFLENVVKPFILVQDNFC